MNASDPRPPAADWRPDLVVCDVDGTVVDDSKTVSDRTRDVLARMRGAGVRLGLVSGRPPRAMAPIAEELGVDLPFAGYNGALYRTPGGETFRSIALEDDDARRLGRFLKEGGVDVWLYRGDEWIVDAPDGPYVARETSTLGFGPVVVADVLDAIDGISKMVGVSDDFDLLALCDREVETAFPRLSAARSRPKYLDVTAGGATKGTAIEVLAGCAGVPLERVMAVGDGHNDVDMFERAAFAVAMGQADEAVRAAADAVTGADDADGLADAIERHVLARAVA